MRIELTQRLYKGLVLPLYERTMDNAHVARYHFYYEVDVEELAGIPVSSETIDLSNWFILSITSKPDILSIDPASANQRVSSLLAISSA